GHRAPRRRTQTLRKRGVEVDHGSVGIRELGVALPPERVPRFLVRGTACFEQLPVDAVDLFRRLAAEGAAHGVSIRRTHPVGIEGLHDLFCVERVAHPPGKGRFDVLLVLRAVRELESEPPVERDRAGHVADDDAEEVELRAYDASAVSVVRSPSSPAIGCSAAITLRMCSSSSRPSPSAPAYTSSRCTPAANEGCFSFFLTDFGSSPSSPVGRTSPTAWTKPESSSHANSVFFSSVSRGRDKCSACESTVSISSSG